MLKATLYNIFNAKNEYLWIIMSIFANKELCMGNFIKQQEERKDAKERDRLRRDKIAGYFFNVLSKWEQKSLLILPSVKKRGMKFNLSQLTFVALVLGTITPIYTNNEYGINWYVLFVSLALTIVLANIGSKILK